MGERGAAHGGVERCEQQVLSHDPRAGDGVEQARLAGIGVTDQRDDGERHRIAGAALQLTGAAHLVEAALENENAVLNLASVGFDLGFARTAKKAAAAALTLKVGPGADQTALLVIEMGEFDLQHTLAGRGALTEDFENQRRAVEDLYADLAFEIALLDGRERRIDDQQFNLSLLGPLGKLLHLPATEIGRRLDFAHAQDFGEHQVERYGRGQPDKFGMPRLGRARITVMPDVGGYETSACGDFAKVHEALAIVVVFFVDQSVLLSGSNS